MLHVHLFQLRNKFTCFHSVCWIVLKHISNVSQDVNSLIGLRTEGTGSATVYLKCCSNRSKHAMLILHGLCVSYWPLFKIKWGITCLINLENWSIVSWNYNCLGCFNWFNDLGIRQVQYTSHFSVYKNYIHLLLLHAMM